MTMIDAKRCAWRALAVSVLAAIAPLVIWGAPTASAKEVIAYFGNESGNGTRGGEFNFSSVTFTSEGVPGDVAVNSTGAGPANPGDVYVADTGNRRIQRFALDDNGTPANPYDDSYDFVSAWGADVVSAGGIGDSGDEAAADFEICTVASECKAGVASSGNGSAAGNGALGGASSRYLAVDEDTGRVYVSDSANARVNVYDGDGAFLRSFGWDVVQAGPGDTGAGFELCVAADGDVCQAGSSGSGLGQLKSEGIAVTPPDGDPGAGTVFVADTGNRRVNTYGLDGSAPGSFGSAASFGSFGPYEVAVDSRGIVYASYRTEGAGEIVGRYDSENANGAGVGFLDPISVPPLAVSTKSSIRQIAGLEVSPDSDGAGPDADVLYVARELGQGALESVVQQFGPVNAPGSVAPPAAADAAHGSVIGFGFTGGFGLDAGSDRLFVSTDYRVGDTSGCVGNLSGCDHRVYVLDTAGGPPTASLDSVDGVTATSATLHATVDPNGGPPVSYRLEYSLDGSTWAKGPEAVLGIQESPQEVEVLLDPPGTGLDPGTTYQVRLIATKAFAPSVVTPSLTFATLATPPDVETVGSPIRTAGTARLEGRVNPRGGPATYWFEYGSDGPCDSSPCATSEPLPAGSGQRTGLVSQLVSGLVADTTYHYRVVADNGDPGGPAAGDSMTFTTRAVDALGHGVFPGPAGSDRAWEQVSVADAGGNPVVAGLSASDDGDRALYQLGGGAPITNSGSGFSQLLAERTAKGWVTRQFTPPRDELLGPSWTAPYGTGDLASLTSVNYTSQQVALWRLRHDGSRSKLLSLSSGEYGGAFMASDDGSRVIASLIGPADPDLPVASKQLYDVTGGTPELVSLLPGEQLPTCAVPGVGTSLDGALPDNPRRTSHWIGAQGERVFFPSPGSDCGGGNQLYMRDLAAEQTELLSGPPVTGTSCLAALIKATPEAAFFWTKTRLVAADTAPAGCGGDGDGDVYRYRFATESLDCVTCVVAGLDADVIPGGSTTWDQIGVAENGSRVYFRSPNRLLPGAEAPGLYRVDVADGDLAYVAPGAGTSAGDSPNGGNALTPDGAVLLFRSSSAALNQAHGADNGGSEQYYRYDDRDRSLICISCPQDGSAATHDAVTSLGPPLSFFGGGVGPNSTPISNGGVVAFATPNALVPADQNTAGQGQGSFAGTDVYEWRDGRVLLVSDGITSWPQKEVVPAVQMVSPSGRDVFFTASAQLTPDALDGYNRLYDARIGGGIEFPEPPPPCPLEVCQGIPRGAPADPAPASIGLRGRGNVREGSSCAASTRLARRLARRTKRLSTAARRVQRSGAPPRRVRLLRRKARRLGGAAKKRRRAAARCRIAQLRRER